LDKRSSSFVENDELRTTNDELRTKNFREGSKFSM